MTGSSASAPPPQPWPSSTLTHLRYAAMIMGEHQIVADLRVEPKDALRNLLTGADWTADVEAVGSS